MTTTKKWIAILAFVLLPGEADARVSPLEGKEQQITLYELVLRDGSRLYGTIEREDPSEVVFKTQAGASVTAQRGDIETLR